MRLINGETMEDIFNAKADMALGTPKEVFFSAARMVALMPTVDAVPVVRCRECVYYVPGTRLGSACLNAFGLACRPKDDDFCSRGERRETDG